MEDTKTTDDGEVDALLRDFLHAELDGQLGRSKAHFRDHLRGPGTGSAGPGSTPGPRRSFGGWVVGIVGGAMAASIAALWAGPLLRTPVRHPTAPALPVAHYQFDLDDVTLSTQTRDGGTVLLGDGRTPARRIYRNELKQIRWVDPEHDVSFEKIVPRQTIMLIEMDTY